MPRLFVIWVSTRNSCKIPWRITLFFSVPHSTPFFLQSKLPFVQSSWLQMLCIICRNGDTIYLQNDISKFLEFQAPWIRQHPSPDLIIVKSKDGHTLDAPGRSFIPPFPQYSQFGHRYLPSDHHYLLSLFPLPWFMLVTQEAPGF